MSSIYIKDIEIENIEKILLGDNKFDDIRREIIRDFDNSFDVNACPGSGKTTVLLAKLMLLVDKMPFDDRKGVCIFTHTNVAVDEIKNRLGVKGEVLFKYPNYIGTIDSFVNKYLATPYYKNYYNKSIKSIDNDEYIREMGKILKDKGCKYDGKYKSWIENKVYFSENKLLNKEIYLKDSNLNVRSLDLENKLGYNIMMDTIRLILEKGFLTFRDSYYLSEIYIKCNEAIKELFKDRFKFVFIDEMQDTRIYQQNLLSKIFNNKDIIVQRFGDKNQDISPQNREDEKCGWTFHNVKEINTTKRYGSSISNVLNYIKYAGEEKLEGNSAIKSLDPHIIVYDNNTIEYVIYKFEELIEKYGLNKTYKCVGRIGVKPNKQDEITIPSYYNKFNKKSSNQVKNYKNELYKVINSNNINDYFDVILEVILRTIRDNGEKYEKSSFKNFLEENYSGEYNTLKQKSLDIYMKVKTDSSDIKILEKEILSFIDSYDKNMSTTYIEQYFKVEGSVNNLLKEIAVTEDNEDISSQIDTVNGVKGETHTATLYLQTKYTAGKNYVGDIDQIIDFMDGTKDICREKITDEGIISSLNIAYVAMSRPTHLLCVAIHIDTIENRIENLESIGYKVIGCTDEIDEKIKQTT